MGGVGSSPSQKEMNPINQALVPVSSLPGHAAYLALCSYMHLHSCAVGNDKNNTNFSEWLVVVVFEPFELRICITDSILWSWLYDSLLRSCLYLRIIQWCKMYRLVYLH